MEQFNTPQEIQRAITNLPPQELAAFRNWFVEYDLKTWDSDIEKDATAGRLDRFVAEAAEFYKGGKVTPL